VSPHPQEDPGPAAGSTRRSRGRPSSVGVLSTAGAVAGLLGLLLFLVPPLGLVSAAGGIVCSGLALTLSGRAGGTPVRAIGGLTCGVAGLVLSAYALVSSGGFPL
jgi:hypothetical protein